jgi:hypothetical protein
LGVSLLLLAACAGEPTGVRAGRELGRRLERRAALHFNSEKYRDLGIRPTEARSGFAMVVADAQFERGETQLELTSVDPADPSRQLGELVSVEVAARDRSGRQLMRREYRGLDAGSRFTTALAGLLPGMTLEVRSEVRGPGGVSATVIATPRVSHRPDLTVLSVSAPAVVTLDVPTIIVATLAELNGQRGARADCLLFDGTTLIDRAEDIWVDAGDAVSCAFSPSFTSTGPRTLTVRVDHVRPQDANRHNNSGLVSFDVVVPTPGGPAVSYSADVRDVDFQRADTFETTWTFPDGRLYLEVNTAYDSTGREQSVLFTAVIGAQVTFPLTRVDLSQSTGGVIIHSARYDQLEPDVSGGGSLCASRTDDTGVSLFICSQSVGFTTLTYLRSAGTVTFQSLQYTKEWNGESYDEFFWVDNGTGSWGELATFGDDFTVSASVLDGGTFYTAAAVVPLAFVDVRDEEPRFCVTGTVFIPPNLLDAFTCFAFLDARVGREGFLSGGGAVVVGGAP